MSDHPRRVQTVYLLLCLAALAILFFTLVRHDLGFISLFPVLFGAVAVAFRWSVGPALTLTILAVLLLAQQIQSGEEMERLGGSALDDFILCSAVLAYVVGHQRLQELHNSILRQAPVRAGEKTHGLAGGKTEHGEHSSSIGGIVGLLLSVLVCAGWAFRRRILDITRQRATRPADSAVAGR